MPFLSLDNDVRLSYDAFGDAGNALVVLVAGAGAPAQFWPRAFCEALALANFRVVRYSHRDTGLSTHFDEAYDIHALLGDLELLVDAFACDNTHIVGHSMGGYLAQLAMCDRPGRFRSATSISAGSAVSDELRSRLGISSPDPAIWEALAQHSPTGDFHRDLPGWMASWKLLNGDLPLDATLATDYTRALYEGDVRNAQVATHHVHAMTTVPASLVSDLPACPVPLLVLHGRNDPLVPLDNAQATVRLAKVATLSVLEGAGHMFFDRQAWQMILSELLKHLRSARHY